MSSVAFLDPQNAPKSHRGSLQQSPDFLAGFKGLTFKAPTYKGTERKGRGGEGKEGSVKMIYAPGTRSLSPPLSWWANLSICGSTKNIFKFNISRGARTAMDGGQNLNVQFLRLWFCTLITKYDWSMTYLERNKTSFRKFTLRWYQSINDVDRQRLHLSLYDIGTSTSLNVFKPLLAQPLGLSVIIILT